MSAMNPQQVELATPADAAQISDLSLGALIDQERKPNDDETFNLLLERDCLMYQSDAQQIYKSYERYLETAAELESQAQNIRKQLGNLSRFSKDLKTQVRAAHAQGIASEGQVRAVSAQIAEKNRQKRQILNDLPHIPQGLVGYFLGPLDVAFVTERQRTSYRMAYERMKNLASLIMALMSLVLLFFKYSFADRIMLFIETIYFLALAFRENILRLNGSRIRYWWLLHHIFSAAFCVLALISPSIPSARQNLLILSAVVGGFQQLQYQRVRSMHLKRVALSHAPSVSDVTATDIVSGDVGIETVQRREFTPLWWLVVVCAFGVQSLQITIGVSLMKMSIRGWQYSGGLLTTLALGNMLTTIITILTKVRKPSGYGTGRSPNTSSSFFATAYTAPSESIDLEFDPVPKPYARSTLRSIEPEEVIQNCVEDDQVTK